MGLVRTVLAALALPALVASGGSVSPLQRAVEASPYTFYHFRRAVWWGEPVALQTRVVHASSDLADIEILARARGRTVGRERLFLARRNGRWAVRAPLIDPNLGAILGPTSNRQPTPQEQAQIAAAGFRELRGERDCVRFTIAVSEVDARYAAARLGFFGPRKAQCEANGTLLFTRAASSSWRYLGAGNAPFPCTSAPAGVIRSLLGECLIRAPR
jgi:hypothetical protein